MKYKSLFDHHLLNFILVMMLMMGKNCLVSARLGDFDLNKYKEFVAEAKSAVATIPVMRQSNYKNGLYRYIFGDLPVSRHLDTSKSTSEWSSTDNQIAAEVDKKDEELEDRKFSSKMIQNSDHHEPNVHWKWEKSDDFAVPSLEPKSSNRLDQNYNEEKHETSDESSTLMFYAKPPPEFVQAQSQQLKQKQEQINVHDKIISSSKKQNPQPYNFHQVSRINSHFDRTVHNFGETDPVVIKTGHNFEQSRQRQTQTEVAKSSKNNLQQQKYFTKQSTGGGGTGNRQNHHYQNYDTDPAASRLNFDQAPLENYAEQTKPKIGQDLVKNLRRQNDEISQTSLLSSNSNFGSTLKKNYYHDQPITGQIDFTKPVSSNYHIYNNNQDLHQKIFSQHRHDDQKFYNVDQKTSSRLNFDPLTTTTTTSRQNYEPSSVQDYKHNDFASKIFRKNDFTSSILNQNDEDFDPTPSTPQRQNYEQSIRQSFSKTFHDDDFDPGRNFDVIHPPSKKYQSQSSRKSSYDYDLPLTSQMKTVPTCKNRRPHSHHHHHEEDEEEQDYENFSRHRDHNRRYHNDNGQRSILSLQGQMSPYSPQDHLSSTVKLSPPPTAASSYYTKSPEKESRRWPIMDHHHQYRPASAPPTIQTFPYSSHLNGPRQQNFPTESDESSSQESGQSKSVFAGQLVENLSYLTNRRRQQQHQKKHSNVHDKSQFEQTNQLGQSNRFGYQLVSRLHHIRSNKYQPGKSSEEASMMEEWLKNQSPFARNLVKTLSYSSRERGDRHNFKNLADEQNHVKFSSNNYSPAGFSNSLVLSPSNLYSGNSKFQQQQPQYQLQQHQFMTNLHSSTPQKSQLQSEPEHSNGFHDNSFIPGPPYPDDESPQPPPNLGSQSQSDPKSGEFDGSHQPIFVGSPPMVPVMSSPQVQVQQNGQVVNFQSPNLVPVPVPPQNFNQVSVSPLPSQPYLNFNQQTQQQASFQLTPQNFHQATPPGQSQPVADHTSKISGKPSQISSQPSEMFSQYQSLSTQSLPVFSQSQIIPQQSPPPSPSSQSQFANGLPTYQPMMMNIVPPQNLHYPPHHPPVVHESENQMINNYIRSNYPPLLPMFQQTIQGLYSSPQKKFVAAPPSFVNSNPNFNAPIRPPSTVIDSRKGQESSVSRNSPKVSKATTFINNASNYLDSLRNGFKSFASRSNLPVLTMTTSSDSKSAFQKKSNYVEPNSPVLVVEHDGIFIGN